MLLLDGQPCEALLVLVQVGKWVGSPAPVQGSGCQAQGSWPPAWSQAKLLRGAKPLWPLARELWGHQAAQDPGRRSPQAHPGCGLWLGWQVAPAHCPRWPRPKWVVGVQDVLSRGLISLLHFLLGLANHGQTRHMVRGTAHDGILCAHPCVPHGSLGYRVLTRVYHMALWGVVKRPGQPCRVPRGSFQEAWQDQRGCSMWGPRPLSQAQRCGADQPSGLPWARPGVRGAPWGGGGSARRGTLARGPSQREPCS